MRMRHSDDKYFILVQLINKAVRKPPHPATPEICAQRMPAFWKPAYTVNGRDYFQ